MKLFGTVSYRCILERSMVWISVLLIKIEGEFVMVVNLLLKILVTAISLFQEAGGELCRVGTTGSRQPAHPKVSPRSSP